MTTALTYTLFVLGYLIHMLLWVDDRVRDTNNAATSRVAVIIANAPKLAARFFISLIIFGIVLAHPDFITIILGYVGISPTGTIGQLFTTAPAGWIAGLYGYGMDSVLGYIPWLKNFVPPLPTTTVGGVATKSQ